MFRFLFILALEIFHGSETASIMLSKLCERYVNTPMCQDQVNSPPMAPASLTMDLAQNPTTLSTNIEPSQPIQSVASTSFDDLLGDTPSAVFKKDNTTPRPKTNKESADTIFGTCQNADLVIGFYCGDVPDTEALRQKCESYRQRCNITRPVPQANRIPDCDKDYSTYFFTCTHNSLPSADNQLYCETFWAYCRNSLIARLGPVEANVYKTGRKYYANTFCQRYKHMGDIYCPTLKTTSLRQDCNFYRMYCAGQNATVQNLTYPADKFPLATFLNPYRAPQIGQAVANLTSPTQYYSKQSAEYGYTGWNSDIAGISGYAGKTMISLKGIANPLNPIDDSSDQPFDPTNKNSLFEIPVAYTNYFMPLSASSPG